MSYLYNCPSFASTTIEPSGMVGHADELASKESYCVFSVFISEMSCCCARRAASSAVAFFELSASSSAFCAALRSVIFDAYSVLICESSVFASSNFPVASVTVVLS